MVLITLKMAVKVYEGGNQVLGLDFQKERNLVIVMVQIYGYFDLFHFWGFYKKYL